MSAASGSTARPTEMSNFAGAGAGEGIASRVHPLNDNHPALNLSPFQTNLLDIRILINTRLGHTASLCQIRNPFQRALSKLNHQCEKATQVITAANTARRESGSQPELTVASIFSTFEARFLRSAFMSQIQRILTDKALQKKGNHADRELITGPLNQKLASVLRALETARDLDVKLEHTKTYGHYGSKDWWWNGGGMNNEPWSGWH